MGPRTFLARLINARLVTLRRLGGVFRFIREIGGFGDIRPEGARRLGEHPAGTAGDPRPRTVRQDLRPGGRAAGRRDRLLRRRPPGNVLGGEPDVTAAEVADGAGRQVRREVAGDVGRVSRVYHRRRADVGRGRYVRKGARTHVIEVAAETLV